MYMKKISPVLAAVLVTFAAIGVARSDETPQVLSEKALSEVSQFFKHSQWDGVKNMLGGAKAIILAPDVTSGRVHRRCRERHGCHVGPPRRCVE